MADCKEECTGVVGPDFNLGDDGKPLQPGTDGPCLTLPNGNPSLPVQVDKSCAPFQLTDNRDTGFIDNIANEHANIGAANLNVYKLLGVHEQGCLIDVTGKGQAISGGAAPGFEAARAFDAYVTAWHSIQTGQGVPASTYIGYDFGDIKLNDASREKYGIPTSVRKHITAITIKQDDDQTKRVTRARVERSEDGKNWYGVAIVLFPDDNCANTILFKSSVLSRYWRIRPLDFNGGTTDYWSIAAIQMYHDFEATNIQNIQDKIFLENRDRDYSAETFRLKGFYDLLDTQSELTKFGIELPSQSFYIVISFSSCVSILGRPLVIGDVIELPSEAQYSPSLTKILKYLEVTDVGWSTEGYTPGWVPTMLRVICQPMFASQETQDIVGDLAADVDSSGLFDTDDGNHPVYQDYSDISQEIEAEGKELVAQRGREGSSAVRQFEDDELLAAELQGLENLNSIGLNPVSLYVEDGMPPNNAPFTEADEFPANPANGDYHRLTYVGLSKDIPARLYRYSTAKGRWVFLEKDRRAEFDPAKPFLQEYLNGTRTPPDQIIDPHEEDC